MGFQRERGRLFQSSILISSGEVKVAYNDAEDSFRGKSADRDRLEVFLTLQFGGGAKVAEPEVQ
eukprot:5798097-Heterocapsa_arctica.AAC.1